MTSLLEQGAALLPDLQRIRRAIHAAPELELQLPRTQRAVLDALADLPIDLVPGVGSTSVTGVIRGATGGPVVLLRADMDALPIVEDTGLPFASTNGAMHACGHDLHIAGLIGAARILAGMPDLPGSVVLMFQPGEETPGGAEVMLREGLLDVAGRRVDAAYGLHSAAWLAAGVFQTRAGTVQASADSITIRVHGRGGHASVPHGALDPVPILAEVILGLQTWVARHVDPRDPIVVSATQLATSGGPVNAIPDDAIVRASVRTVSRVSSARIREEIPRLAAGIASAYGATATVTFDGGYPPTVNDPSETDRVLRTLRDLVGEERVSIAPAPRLGAEDFSLVLEQVPGAYLFLGAGPAVDAELAPTHHSAHAVFDDSVLGDQAAALAAIAIDRLQEG